MNAGSLILLSEMMRQEQSNATEQRCYAPLLCCSLAQSLRRYALLCSAVHSLLHYKRTLREMKPFIITYFQALWNFYKCI